MGESLVGTNKNTLDRPGAVKKIQTATGTVTQSVPGKVTRLARTATTAKYKP